jgi:hypothetical protein
MEARGMEVTEIGFEKHTQGDFVGFVEVVIVEGFPCLRKLSAIHFRAGGVLPIPQ